MKRQKIKSSVWFNADGTHALVQLANGTGWLPNKALAFIVRACWNALDNVAVGSDTLSDQFLLRGGSASRF